MIVEIPHFGSMRGKERELIVLRSDNGDTWKEHQSDVRPEDLTDLLAGMDEGEGNKSSVSHTFIYLWRPTTDRLSPDTNCFFYFCRCPFTLIMCILDAW